MKGKQKIYLAILALKMLKEAYEIYGRQQISRLSSPLDSKRGPCILEQRRGSEADLC